MELDVVADTSSDELEGPPQKSEQSINATGKVAMVPCQELPKASGRTPGMLGTLKAITAQRCEQNCHEETKSFC